MTARQWSRRLVVIGLVALLGVFIGEASPEENTRADVEVPRLLRSGAAVSGQGGSEVFTLAVKVKDRARGALICTDFSLVSPPSSDAALGRQGESGITGCHRSKRAGHLTSEYLPSCGGSRLYLYGFAPQAAVGVRLQGLRPGAPALRVPRKQFGHDRLYVLVLRSGRIPRAIEAYDARGVVIARVALKVPAVFYDRRLVDVC